MRIIKLSKTPNVGFENIEAVQNYFLKELPERDPPGRFQVTAGHIAKDGLQLNEELLFTYDGQVVFTARAGTCLHSNVSESSDKFPSYFVVHLDTLRKANKSWQSLEQQYGEPIQGQGWNRLPSSSKTDAIWAWIDGSEAKTDSLDAHAGATSDPKLSESYSPNGMDCRPLVERQIRERRGQSEFRDALCDRYHNRCMITGCKALAVLEAAHISPYRGKLDHHPENGLLLRSDIHTLFDLNLIGINPENLHVEIHPDLHEEYRHYSGITLVCPTHSRPSHVMLSWRFDLFMQRLGRPA